MVPRGPRDFRAWSVVNRLERAHLTDRAAERHKKAVDAGWYKSEVMKDLSQAHDQLQADLPGYVRRREMEQELADYIERMSLEVDPTNIHHFRSDSTYSNPGIVDRLRNCRCDRCSYAKPDGGIIHMYDSKCGLDRLCPDEAREATKRVTERYVPEILNFMREKRSHRAFYLVMTKPNFEVGNLYDAKRSLQKDFKSWMTATRPVTQEDIAKGLATSRTKKLPVWPQIQGALTVQEDPLAAAGDWNVHLNVVLLVDGRIDYKAIRETWGCNVEIRELKGTPGALARTFLEVLKYSAQIVGEKSASKMKKGQSGAPAMTEWPHERFLEWWLANKGFRRLRTYGRLYKVNAEEEANEKMDIADMLASGELIPLGSTSYSRDSGVSVDLILDDNFLLSSSSNARQRAPNHRIPIPDR
jgi:hypothetical protein